MSSATLLVYRSKVQQSVRFVLFFETHTMRALEMFTIVCTCDRDKFGILFRKSGEKMCDNDVIYKIAQGGSACTNRAQLWIKTDRDIYI